MKFQEAIQASDYNTAQIEQSNGRIITVDGSLLDGEYDIKTAIEGMPPYQTKHVESLDAALEIIQAQGLNTSDWVAIGEDGEPQA